MKDISYTDEGWSVNGRPLPDPQDYKRLALSLSRMEAEEVGLSPTAQTFEHTRVTSAPETDSSNVPPQDQFTSAPVLVEPKMMEHQMAAGMSPHHPGEARESAKPVVLGDRESVALPNQTHRGGRKTFEFPFLLPDTENAGSQRRDARGLEDAPIVSEDGSSPCLAPSDNLSYIESAAQWHDERQREYDQPNQSASLPAEERINEEEV